MPHPCGFFLPQGWDIYSFYSYSLLQLSLLIVFAFYSLCLLSIKSCPYSLVPIPYRFNSTRVRLRVTEIRQASAPPHVLSRIPSQAVCSPFSIHAVAFAW